MRTNKLGYLGLLGFLGLLGLVTGIFGFYGYFGFFGFFAMLLRKASDERIEGNVNRACRNAFAYHTVISAFSLAYTAAFRYVEAWSLALVLLSSFGILVFGVSYNYYESRGD